MKKYRLVQNTLDCGHMPSESTISSGYGVDKDGNKHCYQCCAEYDKQAMRDTGKATLYLTLDDDTGRTMTQWGYRYGDHKITNWPGSLTFRTHAVKTGQHNMARVRYDFWFNFEGETWHGVQYGDNTQIAHCRRTKA